MTGKTSKKLIQGYNRMMERDPPLPHRRENRAGGTLLQCLQ